MRTTIADWLKSHPENEFNKSLLWHEMKLKKWELLFTPPYESWLQPIELIWGPAKFIVAKQSYDGRKWTETQSQTKAALKEVSQFCPKMIQHTERLMDEWLQGEAAGSLKQYGSIAELAKLTPDQRHQCTDLNLEGSRLVGDAQ